jgi:inosine-uridine nucleoside N-ribohydrolase
MLPLPARKVLLVLFFGFLGATNFLLAARIPVVLDTDIGTDIDDTWALAQLLRSPDLDLKLVLTDTGDTHYRAALAAKFLEAAGRTDVAVGIGQNQGMSDDVRNQAPWLVGYDLSKYPGHVHADGIAALIDLVMKSPEPVTIIAIGAVPNLALALQREPRIAAKCRFVGMHGSFDVGYGGSTVPVAEANVKGDVAALRAVLAAPWRDILLTPLDTCGLVQLDDGNYHAIWGATADPTLRAIIENYCIFAPRVTWMHCDFFAMRSTTLFDCVAVYLASSEALVDVETVSFAVTDDGFTRRAASGPFKARVALRWKNLPAFEDQLAKQLLGQH